MTYSPAFASLPAQARSALLDRMREILKERRDTAVLEILDETLSDFAQLRPR
jgi:acyl-CoA reductase-like NAD-dependent aldehyde dehydrogenase